ncbi:uncharacterized protein LOC132263495 [Phlebotomus argentipes]|uniref:uncharacterized protein LOC132263495 n=1 Tax=Phlebotomus argentipes TaxID=94469 RepID=UPI002892EBCE|nr:uncharacterized protein LOC132263495 [Phlebotomus argentipes]
MGCKTSSSVTPDIEQIANQSRAINVKDGETFENAFQKLDEEILLLEMRCPGARLATAEAWVEHLESLKRQNELPIDFSDDPFTVQDTKPSLSSEKEDLHKVRTIALQLGITVDGRKAVEQEEFMAKVSARSIHITDDQLHLEMIQHGEQRIEDLKQEFTRLKSLYEEQDGLWASITGGIYSSALEERLERELSEARQMRDRLASVAEQWRTSGALLQAATKCSQQVIQYWNLIPLTRKMDDKLSLVLDCRHALQAAIKAYEGAQSALPQAEILRNRLLASVKNASLYLITDMVNEKKYEQAKKAFEDFQEILTGTLSWLQNTFSESLGKDIRDSEEVMVQLAKRLRQERLKFIATQFRHGVYLPRNKER